MLISVKYLDRETRAECDAAINLDDIQSALSIDGIDDGPFTEIWFKNGKKMIIVGESGQLLASAEPVSGLITLPPGQRIVEAADLVGWAEACGLLRRWTGFDALVREDRKKLHDATNDYLSQESVQDR